VFDLVVGVAATKMIAGCARLGVAVRLAERGPLTGAELAAATGQNADAMHRMLRALASIGVFSLASDGRFSNNFRSEALRSEPAGAWRSFAEYFGTRSNVLAWNELDEVLRTGKSGFRAGVGQDVWTFFDEHPAERDLFAAAMRTRTQQMAPVIAEIYPWEEIGSVCDVGGGCGTLLSELCARVPGLHGVLYDMPGVTAQAPALFAEHGVADRTRIESGSFFERVPSGCDAYALKSILHDWDDERSIAILRNVREAAGRRGRVLVMEALLPRNATGLAALIDVQMMVVTNEGRERSREDYARLFAASGLALRRIFEHSLVSVLEAVAT
jgi:hypothetical protein